MQIVFPCLPHCDTFPVGVSGEHRPPLGGGCVSPKLAGSLDGESTAYGQTLASFWRASATPWGWLCESETRRVAQRRINNLRADFDEFLESHETEVAKAQAAAGITNGGNGQNVPPQEG